MINSALVLAIASTDPNSPIWAEPTTNTTPTSGELTLVNFAISPKCLAPISTMQNLVFSLHLKSVNGTPISVLKFASVATHSPTDFNIECRNSLVVVLPCEPVIPITFISESWPLTNSVKVKSAWLTSATTIEGAFTGLETKANFAPDLIASSTKE